jgi:hypothetical protein
MFSTASNFFIPDEPGHTTRSKTPDSPVYIMIDQEQSLYSLLLLHFPLQQVPLLDFGGLRLKRLARHKIRNVIVIVISVLLAFCSGLFLHALVALSELAQRGQRVGTQLVENSRDKLRQLLLFAVAIDGKGV